MTGIQGQRGQAERYAAADAVGIARNTGQKYERAWRRAHPEVPVPRSDAFMDSKR